jgi:hypothetical protein
MATSAVLRRLPCRRIRKSRCATECVALGERAFGYRLFLHRMLNKDLRRAEEPFDRALEEPALFSAVYYVCCVRI